MRSTRGTKVPDKLCVAAALLTSQAGPASTLGNRAAAVSGSQLPLPPSTCLMAVYLNPVVPCVDHNAG